MQRDNPVGLLKVGRLLHLERFARLGELYMRTLREFSTEESPERGDPFEGSSYLFPAGAELSVEVDGEFRPIPGVSSIRHSSDADGDTRAFCMYGIWSLDEPVGFSDQNAGFGDYFAYVTHVDEFIHRAKARLPGGTRAEAVGYVGDEFWGPMGPFRKRLAYAHQSEFRIAVPPDSKGPTRRIGRLSDIVIIGRTSDIAGKRVRAVLLSDVA